MRIKTDRRIPIGILFAVRVSAATASTQTRQGHWAIIDLIGEDGHGRTVPIPQWPTEALDHSMPAAGKGNSPALWRNDKVCALKTRMVRSTKLLPPSRAGTYRTARPRFS